MKYRIVITWLVAPTPADLATLNSYGDRAGNNKRFLQKIAAQIETMHKVIDAEVVENGRIPSDEDLQRLEKKITARLTRG